LTYETVGPILSHSFASNPIVTVYTQNIYVLGIIDVCEWAAPEA